MAKCLLMQRQLLLPVKACQFNVLKSEVMITVMPSKIDGLKLVAALNQS